MAVVLTLQYFQLSLCYRIEIMFSETFKKKKQQGCFLIVRNPSSPPWRCDAVSGVVSGLTPSTGPTVGTCNPYLSQESMCCNIFMFGHIYSVLTVENVLCVEAQRLLPVVKPLSAFFVFYFGRLQCLGFFLTTNLKWGSFEWCFWTTGITSDLKKDKHWLLALQQMWNLPVMYVVILLINVA